MTDSTLRKDGLAPGFPSCYQLEVRCGAELQALAVVLEKLGQLVGKASL